MFLGLGIIFFTVICNSKPMIEKLWGKRDQ
jgi:hypothetical protein